MYNVAFLYRNKLAKLILEKLENPKPATILAKEKDINKHRSAVSRCVLDLEKKKLVTCLNPKDKRDRFYQITQEGKKILKEFQEFSKQKN